jgi:hypothetical protein
MSEKPKKVSCLPESVGDFEKLTSRDDLGDDIVREFEETAHKLLIGWPDESAQICYFAPDSDEEVKARHALAWLLLHRPTTPGILGHLATLFTPGDLPGREVVFVRRKEGSPGQEDKHLRLINEVARRRALGQPTKVAFKEVADQFGYADPRSVERIFSKKGGHELLQLQKKLGNPLLMIGGGRRDLKKRLAEILSDPKGLAQLAAQLPALPELIELAKNKMNQGGGKN